MERLPSFFLAWKKTEVFIVPVLREIYSLAQRATSRCKSNKSNQNNQRYEKNQKSMKNMNGGGHEGFG